MDRYKIYNNLADNLCLAFILGSQENYQWYRSDYKKYNLKVKPEPYSDRINKVMQQIELNGEEVSLDKIIQYIFKANRGSYEREQSAIREALEELTELTITIDEYENHL